MTFIFSFSKYESVFCLKVVLLNINKILIFYYCQSLALWLQHFPEESCAFNKASKGIQTVAWFCGATEIIPLTLSALLTDRISIAPVLILASLI